jgi:hypothetical protein
LCIEEPALAALEDLLHKVEAMDEVVAMGEGGVLVHYRKTLNLQRLWSL